MVKAQTRGKDLLPFLQCVLQLKSVKRTGWVSKVKIENAESVADHSYSLCSIAMLLSDLEGLDTCKAMKMVLLHDLAESVIGDYMPGDLGAKEKTIREKAAMTTILKGLPPDLRSEYKKIWNEYVRNDGGISRFVHRLDKLEMALQANQYVQKGYNQKLLTPFLESAKAAVGNEGDLVNDVLMSLDPRP